MSGAHEGCSQGKSVRDREGSKHSTAATLERVEGEAAVLPQAFKDRVLARQLAGVVQESGAKDESSRFGTLTFNMTHASERATRRGREKKSKSDPHCWSRKVCRISFHTHVQHVMAPPSTAQAPDASVLILRNLSLSGDLRRFSTSQSGRVG